MAIRILHFSDFHLDSNHVDWAKNLLSLMIESIKQANVKPDLILFTGDMLNKGKGGFASMQDGFNTFKREVIDVLCGELILEPSQFIFVPGNHDIDRTVINDIVEAGIETITTSEVEVNNLIHRSNISDYTQRMQAYKDFEKTFYDSAIGANYHFDRFASTFKVRIGETTIGLLGLNSVWRCGIDDEKKIVLGRSQITENMQYIRDCDIKIALCHHHYTHVKEFERENLKANLIDDVDMYFTGHEHRNQTEYVYIDNGNGFFDVNTAGSLTTNIYIDDEKYKNAFQIVTYYPESKKIETSVYKQKRGELFIKDMAYGVNGVNTCFALTQEQIREKLEAKAIENQQQEEASFYKEIFPFKPIKKYLNNKERFREKFVTNEKIDEIIEQLRGEGKRMRFMALSGMGKTRIVLEAFREQQDVYYTPVCECEKGLLRLLEHKKEGVIVVDNCPIEKQRDIEKILAETANQFKLITIHNVLTTNEMRVDAGLLEMTYLDSAQIIDKMLSDNPQIAANPDIKERIRKRSGNIPFMAILLIQAYEQNHNLRIENRDAVLSALLASCEADSDQWKVLNSVSIFDPLGKDGGLKDEYEFVITNPDIHHIGKEQRVVNTIFKNTLREYEERQLVEHDGACIRVRPMQLAEWLAEDWLQRNGQDLEGIFRQIHGLEENLSNRLMQRINKRFKGLKDSPYAQGLVEQFNAPGVGVFGDERLAFSYVGSQLFLSMGQVSPAAVASNMYALLQKKSKSWLQKEMDYRVRRNWVWALTNIVADAAAFPDAARSLLLLARAESEEYANNATGQFKQLFHVMLCGTMAPLAVRADLIEEMYRDGVDRNLIIDTIHSAYTYHGVTLDMNDGAKDEDGNLREYKPGTYGEVHQYWLRCKDVLEKIANENDTYRDKIREWLPNCIRDMCEYGSWVVYEKLLESFYREGEDWMEMYNGLSMYIEHGHMTDQLRAKLEEWKEKLAPKDFCNRLDRIQVEAFSNKKMSFDERWKYEAEQIRPMVEEFINRKLYEDGYTLPTMIRDEAYHNYHFAEELVKELEKGAYIFEEVSYYIIEAIRKEPKVFESIFIGMFASYIQNKDRLDRFRDALYDMQYYRMAAWIDGLADDEDHSRLAKVIEAFENGKYDAYCVDNYLRRVRYHNLNNVLGIFSVLHNHPSKELDYPAYRFVSYTAVYMSTEEILSSGKMKELQEVLLSYPYKENANHLAHEYVHKIEQILEESDDPDFAYAVHRKAVETLSVEYISNNPFEQLYFTLLPKYQDAVLPDLLEVLADEKNLYYGLSMTNHLGSGFGTGKGPLFQCGEEALKEACKKYPERMPRLLANMCPIYEWENEKIVSLSKFFLWLCDEFGDNTAVLHAFDANLNTFSWTGFGISEHYAAEIPYFEPLLQHPRRTVREWAKAEIESIKQDVKREGNKEGYERMTMD